MLVRHKQLLESYERVRDFLAANVPPNPAPTFARWRDELAQAIARLNALLGDQVGGTKDRRDDVRRQRAARRALRERHLAPIARIAKAQLADDPMAVESLSMPDGQQSAMKLVAEAIAFRAKAAQHEDVFVQAGRPADFLAQLDAAIEALRGSVLGKARSVGKHVGARAGIGQALRRARQVLGTLDAMVLDAFAGNAELLARWRVAKRVQSPPGARSGPRATGGTADENTPEGPQPEAA